MKKINILILSIILFAFACSKDRSILLTEGTAPTPVTPDPPVVQKDDFIAVNPTMLDNLGVQPEKKTIKNDNDLPFIGKQGSNVWLYTRDLKTENGGAIGYPFDIEILELLTPKDMILHQMPTVSGGKLLSTGGQIRVRAYKDGKELKLNAVNSAQITVLVKGRIDAFMQLFYGSEVNGEFTDWYPADTSKRQQPSNGYIFPKEDIYVIFPTRIGWINVDKFYQYTEPTTKITFLSETPPITNVFIYLYFPDLKSIMGVSQGVSGLVPVGRNVKVIAIGITKEEKYYSFFQEFAVQDKQKVEIKLAPTTKEALMKYLDTL
jgi:hypothetical protein